MQCVIYDLEATCWEGEPLADQSEVIEIAAYKVDRYGDISGPFQSFVRPILFPILSPYCKNLTRIKQSDVDTAPEFAEIIDDFLEWVQNSGEETLFCAWGKYDPGMIRRDCELHNYPADWLQNTIDLKKKYAENRGLKKPLGLIKSCDKEDIDWEGTPHRALWDTYNLLKLFMKYYGEWNLSF